MREFDDYLRQINSKLKGFEAADYISYEKAPPAIHVIGPPRTGTTLLIQVLRSSLALGYIDNLAAMFWSSPVFGILASQKLLGRERHASNFHSNFGRTEGISEPHEFGRFWLEALNYGDMVQKPAAHEDTIDWMALAARIRNMGAAFARPFLLKSFLLIWHLSRYHRAVPESLYVRLKRDPLQTAISILKARRDRGADLRTWVSLKPLACAAYDEEPWWLQIAAQIHFINAELDRQLSEIPPGHVLVVAHEDLQSDPQAIAGRARDWLSSHGFAMSKDEKISLTALGGRGTGIDVPKEEIALLTRGLAHFSQ